MKVVLTIEVPEVNLLHYPDCETQSEAREFDWQQVEDGTVSEVEYLDMLMSEGATVEFHLES